MEAGIASDRERVCFSEPGRARQAHVNGKNRLESHAQESWRDKISDLQLASRLLHSVERSGSGRCRRACQAPHKPGNPSVTASWEWPIRYERPSRKRTNGCAENARRYISVTVRLRKENREKSACISS